MHIMLIWSYNEVEKCAISTGVYVINAFVEVGPDSQMAVK